MGSSWDRPLHLCSLSASSLQKSYSLQGLPWATKAGSRINDWGGVKIAAWEDAEFVSPHNYGSCQMLVGDLYAQGDGMNPEVTR